MATNDGYSPYPIGLTASQSVEAIRRAYDLDVELEEYVKMIQSETPPAKSTSKMGDLWYNITSQKIYRAYLEDNILVWIEV
jgi:hypothetical protein